MKEKNKPYRKFSEFSNPRSKRLNFGNWTYIFVMLLVLGMIGFVSGYDIIESKTDKVEKDQTYIIEQFCANSTYANISSIKMSSINMLGQVSMTEISSDYYQYNFTNTSLIGTYTILFYCNENGEVVGSKTDFEVTSTGEDYNQIQTGMIIAQGIIIALFVGLGFSFSKERWKLRGLFFVLALFMGVILINSIRILSGSSETLTTMNSAAFIIGIVAVSFMAIYLLIHYTIEIFQSFKNKKAMKWEVSNRFS